MMQEVVYEIERLAKSVVDQVHTVLPCKIVSFDASLCTAQVQPYGKFTLSNGKQIKFPAISDVPVVMFMSQPQDMGIAFPIKAGDDGLLLISEIELDAWKSQAESEGLLKFDLTSGIFMPGIIRQSALLKEATEQNALILKWGAQKITLSNSDIAISGNLKVSGDISYGGELKPL